MSELECACLCCGQTHFLFEAVGSDALGPDLIWMMERQWQGGAIGEIIAREGVDEHPANMILPLPASGGWRWGRPWGYNGGFKNGGTN